MDPDSSSHDYHSLSSDPVTATNDDPCISMNIEPALHEDLRMNIDPLSSRQSIHCINCGADTESNRRHFINLAEVHKVILQWIAPQQLNDDSNVCHSCWIVALNASSMQEFQEASTSSGAGRHRQLCVSCRTSLLRTRSHEFINNTERERRIRDVIIQWSYPHELRATDRVCHLCWQRADRHAARDSSVSQEPSLSGVSGNESITVDELHSVNSVEMQSISGGEANYPQNSVFLSNLKRAPDSQARCFLPGCGSLERLKIPLWLRIHIFVKYKYYVPQNCRICEFHLQNDQFDVLQETPEAIKYFTVSHIQDFATFVKETNFDFNNIESMSDDAIRYWTGITRQQFRQLKSDVPQINSMKNGCMALAAYLIKIRTGDSDERISIMLNIPKTTLIRKNNKIRDILQNVFVPRNLGVHHISRDEISQRNLLIPNGLFGGDDRHPIIIMDGTYIYIQKSSNYMHQKDTYSLHKYRNLMKPFLMVCSDGYIIDVLGPYPATTSDATILINEFNNESNTLRAYFQPGDVFILDRGFRDSVPLLQECGYNVHFPVSLQPGETQLSTAAANQSRTVTICRWVVEAVNGIFKMCFKIFRSEFFNTASTHAISDFKIAAALINKFHRRVTDRLDATLILEMINEKLHRPNLLADFVIENNINRRRTHFSTINVSLQNLTFPRLTYSELILIACGTYQLKQARSYYGEHIRNDGTYTIEVCIDRASSLLEGFPSAANCTLLRGRIKSRHISCRIYYVYIIFNNNDSGIDAIKQYCCNCLVGPRAVGCCAHIMTVLWYLSWARYENVTPPAQFLDNILITYDN